MHTVSFVFAADSGSLVMVWGDLFDLPFDSLTSWLKPGLIWRIRVHSGFTQVSPKQIHYSLTWVDSTRHITWTMLFGYKSYVHHDFISTNVQRVWFDNLLHYYQTTFTTHSPINWGFQRKYSCDLWVFCYFIAFNRLNTFVYIENLQYVHIQVSDLLLVPSIFLLLFSYRLL